MYVFTLEGCRFAARVECHKSSLHKAAYGRV